MDDLVALMKGGQLQDILVGGWLSGEGRQQEFVPVLKTFLFRFENGTAVLSSFEGRIDVSIRPDVRFEYDVSELGESCFTSLLNLLVWEGDVNLSVCKVTFYKDSHSSHTEAIVFEMCGGTILFIEVDLVYGLHISSSAEYNRWLQWRQETSQESSTQEFILRT